METDNLSDIHNISNIISDLKKISEFRRERWENAEMRLSIVWDQSLEKVKELISNHSPTCRDNCYHCWLREKINGLMRGSLGNYTPIKERLGVRGTELIRRYGANRPDYIEGVKDMIRSAQFIFGEKE